MKRKLIIITAAFLLAASVNANDQATTWIAKYYVDEFKQPTDEGYITTDKEIEGTFSNSATTDSLLKVRVLLDDEVAFKLYEYGDNLVTGYYKKEYAITVLDSNKEKHSMSGTLYKDSDRVYLDTEYIKQFYDILCQGGSVSVYIKDKNYPASYLFTLIDCDGFENTYIEKFGDVPRNYNPDSETEVSIMESSVTIKDHVPQISINTNLPDGVILSAVFDKSSYITYHHEGDYFGEVKDGKCVIDFKHKHVTDPDYYSVRLWLNPQRQPIDIQKQYGSDLSGIKGAVADDLKSQEGFRFIFDFN